MTPQELAKMLFTDFGDEMASRDEILKAADDPNAAPISIGPAKSAKPPPIPAAALQAKAGEMQSSGRRAKIHSGPIEAVPSVMLTPASQRVQMPPDLESVLDLSQSMGQDAWMAEGGTDLLSAHRWKSLRNLGIAVVALALIAGAVIFFVSSTSDDDDTPVHAVKPPPDAAVRRTVIAPPPDATDISHEDIVALSRYGFFSINATGKTTIYIDGKLIGETPLTRLPYPPGPHTVKAVGPKGKSKQIKITILGGRDDDEGTIDWDQPQQPPPH